MNQKTVVMRWGWRRNLLLMQRKGNLLWFINHRCMPNCNVMKQEIDGHPITWIVVLEEIHSGSFLSFGYHRNERCKNPACGGG